MLRPRVAGAHARLREKTGSMPRYLAPITFKCLHATQAIAFCARRARHETFETGKINRPRSD